MQSTAQPPTAVVIAGDEEIRVLLRGLLRLHHFRVLGEATGEEQGLQMLRTYSPRLVVADMSLADGSVASLFASVRGFLPQIRTVVVAPAGTDAAAADGADAVLHRPFRVKEFSEAVGGTSRPSS